MINPENVEDVTFISNQIGQMQLAISKNSAEKLNFLCGGTKKVVNSGKIGMRKSESRGLK